jgi:CBS domain containing-hemolysin-like protein
MSGLDLILLLLCLLGSALYSGLETGVVSVNRLRLQHLVRQQRRGADLIQQFLARPDHLLGTTLVGTNLCNVVVSVTAASLLVAWVGTAGYVLSTLLTTVVLLILGEYLPKAWFRGYPAYRVLPFARFLAWSGHIFYPLSMVATHLARLLIPGGAAQREDDPVFMTREEFQYLAAESERAGELSSSEGRMVRGVLQLTRKTCGQLMVPRERMVIAHPETTVAEALDWARRHRVSRLPIYDEEQSKFIGLVHILDLLTAGEVGDRYVKEFARPPQYVQATARADQLLPRMRLSRQPLALVRDEADTVIGLLSLEDILEEIVGRL